MEILEWIGVVAIALSGAMVGVRKEMDIFGVNVLGVTTAVGGGFVRDLALGVAPPQALRDPDCALVAIVTSTALFLYLYFRRRAYSERAKTVYELGLLYCDALGLGAFTVLGVDTAFRFSAQPSWFTTLFMGLLTGTGGGILRDIMAGQSPYIFTKHIYACASLAGGAVYLAFRGLMPRTLAAALSVAVTVALRGLANRYRWNLPRIRSRDTGMR